MNYKKYKPGHSRTETLALYLFGLIFFFGFFTSVNYALNNAEDRHNASICHSARISGNDKYLELCQPYYQTNNIKTMRGRI